MELSSLENTLHYTFREPSLLERALTHSSYCRENGLPMIRSNERLEFLGDAFLDAIVGAELFRRLEGSDEGKLSKSRAYVVCEDSLESAARSIALGGHLRLGKGEEQEGGRERPSMLADAAEAVIGAVYLDGGYGAAEEFVLRLFRERIEDVLNGHPTSDAKSILQEKLQKDGSNPSIRYVLDRSEGPDHDKTFFVHLEINGEVISTGSGKTKKKAEQRAAKAALQEGI